MEPETVPSFDKAIRINKLLSELLTSSTCPDSSILAVMTCLNVRFIYEAAEGYIILQQMGKDAAARQMIRPIVETVLWMAATEDQPDLLFRWIFTNEEEERKLLLANISEASAQQFIHHQFDQRADDIRSKFEKEFPHSTLDCSKISLLCALQIAGKRTRQNREKPYHELYRTYCQYTHATLNAKADYWDSMHPIDDAYVVFWGQSLALLSLKNHASIQTADDDVDAWIEDLQKSSCYKL